MSAHLLLLHSISVFKLNGKYSRSSMGAGAPRGASKATKCDRNEGAVGNWFLLRGWQMLMLTDRESDYSELRRWTSACVSWLPLQQNHSQSHLHKSSTHTLAQFENSTTEQRWSCRWKGVYHERVPLVTTKAVCILGRNMGACDPEHL